MKEKTKTTLQIVVLVILAILGLVYMIHKGNNEKRYAEANNCQWVAQGGLSVCK